jgi:hypothetical protein
MDDMSSLRRIRSPRTNRHQLKREAIEHAPVPVPGEYSDWLRSATPARLALFPRLPMPPQPNPLSTLVGYPIGFVPRLGKPAPPAATSLPSGSATLITGWLTQNWVRFIIFRRRRSPAPSTPRSSCAGLLIHFELTRNWLRSVNSWLPPPPGPRPSLPLQ